MGIISPIRNLVGVSALALVFTLGVEVLASEPDSTNATEADIARATADLLDHSQFSRRPFDDLLSSQLLDGYLDALDSAHLLFLQSDVEEFERLGTGLAQRILLKGDTRPAHSIYSRYLERLGQETDFAVHLLHKEKFDFTGQDSWQADRRDAPRPRDLTDAQGLWRDSVREDYLQEKLNGAPTRKIATMLARRYTQLARTMRLLNTNDILEIYLDALAHVYDPHSDYFGHEESQNFKISLNLSLAGIGGTLAVKGGYCIITELIPGGPAARSGLLKPGDRIVAVAQDEGDPESVIGMPAMQVVALLRGPKGSTVRLTIVTKRGADLTRKTVSLVRDEVKLLDEHAHADLIDVPQASGQPLRIGVLNLPIFYGKGDVNAGGVSSDTAYLIKALLQDGVQGLILDLRGNEGGSIEEAVQLMGLFVPAAPVVQMLGHDDNVEIAVSPQTNALYNGPLVVLTSRISASASEIVAGALQDYGRALIVGDSSTFGKGTIQNVVPLREFFHQRGLGAVNVTIGKFYRPSGESTQLKGVIPDIILPTETDLPDIGEAKLPNALPWDILPPTTYPKLNLVGPVLAGLREKCQARIGSDPGFILVRQELAMAQKNEKAKLLSMNEVERRRQKKQTDDIIAQMNRLIRLDIKRWAPSRYITVAGSKAAPSSDRLAETAETNPGAEIELHETENIFSDYIHALPSRLEESSKP